MQGLFFGLYFFSYLFSFFSGKIPLLSSKAITATTQQQENDPCHSFNHLYTLSSSHSFCSFPLLTSSSLLHVFPSYS
ncbi:hypothetical protein F5H01DRAFT_348984 [Linnemannia elongata]|nr:hypothetical protein F5H01DRAFT_348984 [Linnemannia elongata]